MDLLASLKELVAEEKVSRRITSGASGSTISFGLEYEFWGTGSRTDVAKFVAIEGDKLGLSLGKTHVKKDQRGEGSIVNPIQDFRKKKRRGREEGGDEGLNPLKNALVTTDASVPDNIERPDGSYSGGEYYQRIRRHPDEFIDWEDFNKRYLKSIRDGDISDSDDYKDWVDRHAKDVAEEIEADEDSKRLARDLITIAGLYGDLSVGRSFDIPAFTFFSDRMRGKEKEVVEAIAEILAKELVDQIPESERLGLDEDLENVSGKMLEGLYYEEDDEKKAREFHKESVKIIRRMRSLMSEINDSDFLKEALRMALLSNNSLDADDIMSMQPRRPQRVLVHIENIAGGEVKSLVQSVSEASKRVDHPIMDQLLVTVREYTSTLEMLDSTNFSFDDWEDSKYLAEEINNISELFIEVYPQVEAMAGMLSDFLAKQLSDSWEMTNLLETYRTKTLSKMKEKHGSFVPVHKDYRPKSGKHQNAFMEGHRYKVKGEVSEDDLKESFLSLRPSDVRAAFNKIRNKYSYQISMNRKWDEFVRDQFDVNVGNIHPYEIEKDKNLREILPKVLDRTDNEGFDGWHGIMMALLGEEGVTPQDFLPHDFGQGGDGKFSDAFYNEYKDQLSQERSGFADEGGSPDREEYGVEINLPPLTLNEKNINAVMKLLNRVKETFDARTTPHTGLHVHLGIWDRNVPLTSIISLMVHLAENERELVKLSGRFESRYAQPNMKKGLSVLASMMFRGDRDHDPRPYIFGSPRSFMKHFAAAVQGNERFHGANLVAWVKGTVELRYAKSLEGDELKDYLMFIKSLVEKAKADAGGFVVDLLEPSRGYMQKVRIEPTTTGGIEAFDLQTGERMWGSYGRFGVEDEEGVGDDQNLRRPSGLSQQVLSRVYGDIKDEGTAGKKVQQERQTRRQQAQQAKAQQAKGEV